MKRLSGIARDYLADFEILNDARSQFEDELKEWWQSLLVRLIPIGEQEKAVPLEHWENKSNGGCFQLYAADDYSVIMEMRCPRHSGVRDYQLDVHGNATKLKGIREDSKLMARLRKIAADEGLQPLFPSSGRLVEATVALQPDDPDGTLRNVKATVRKLLKLLVAVEQAHRAG